MSIVFLNDTYLPMEEARISPMDRGFLFGDGIYEVIPSYAGRLVGFGPHIERLQNGLKAVSIECKLDTSQWRDIANTLITKNGSGNLGIYLHVSRGADNKRFHAYPGNISPTIFAFAFDIALPPAANRTLAKGYRVSTTQDLRWQRCHIKSTSLLGNVMHFQQGFEQGTNEVLLYNAKRELTEAAACNAYVVKEGVVATPPLDHQILPGITRFMLLDILRQDGSIRVEERVISMDEVFDADEIWVTSSSKEIAPVIEVDGKPVGDGRVGPVWEAAQALYSARKFHY